MITKIKIMSQMFVFKEVLEHYLKHYEARNKSISYMSVKNAIKLHIEPYFNNKKITKISNRNILDW